MIISIMLIDRGTAKYIVSEFGHLLTDKERLAVHCITVGYKLKNAVSQYAIIQQFRRLGLGKDEQEILNFFESGYDGFELKLALKISEENPDKVFLNNCSECGMLARTSLARQCRYCGHSWHGGTAAEIIDRGL